MLKGYLQTLYVEGDPVSEFLKDGIHADTVSWGLVINTFNDLEKVYLDYLKEELGHDRVWAVGPILPSADDHMSRPIERGGSSSDLGSNILSWLDKCDDHKVVYVCFGSKAVLTNKQMEELALGLEKSGAKFIWCVKEQNKGHVEEEYGVIPIGFEDRVVGRGLVIKEWVPQTLILKHRAVGAFLTHCGWNSVLEGLIAGVPMLTWPMGAEQFVNATLLVDELKVAIRVCEGAQAIPSSTDIARMVAKSVCENCVERVRTMELHEAALGAIKKGGSSFKDLHELVKCLFNEASQAKLCDVQE
ncbi:hypothetical protein F0562_025052 [Nyssa sinensis]|uniref:Uncharacterized protein n=1 Tax=Nyssa sinensis TaxID=561372 RepID=A0A5J5BEF3_9ASTE|nr:hypothetical protein F0562_025052 [Nyssa sinensis]